jgi:hypothetical protein
MAAERRIFRVGTGAVAETLLTRAPLNVAETTDYFNVAAGKVLRMTDFRFTSEGTTDAVFRLRAGQTTAGEELARWVLPTAMTYAQDVRTPLRIDGGNNGQDLALTCECPVASPIGRVSAAVIGHQD